MARRARALMEPVALDALLAGVEGWQLARPALWPVVSGVSTDTRTLRPGDLFVALKGERSDGHRFVRQALEAGAVAAAVQDMPTDAPSGPLVVVEDTLRFLGDLARSYRRWFQIPIVAVTGSVGKTSVKEMTAALLRTRYQTLASDKNYNNEIGVPHTLFELSGQHEIAVVEMGMRGPGEIDRLAEIAEPTIAVITNIGHSHVERLGSREGIAAAKAELLRRLPAGGVAILPRFDAFYDYLVSAVPATCRIVTFSDSPDGNPDVTVGAGPELATAIILGSKQEIALGTGAAHVARNAAAALAVGLAADVPISLARHAFRDLAPVEGRLRWLAGKKGVTVLDDCYNAAPESMAAALDALRIGPPAALTGAAEAVGATAPVSGGAQTAGDPAHRVAVLGDMRELGELGPELHRNVGRLVGESDVRLLVTVGELSLEIAREAERTARRDGKPTPLHRHFADSVEAAASLEALLSPGDVILVKGSRAMEMERIVAALTGEPGAGAHG